jgi:hypothetical protein
MTVQDDLAAIKAALDAGPTPGPWTSSAWGMRVMDAAHGSSQVLIATVATNTRCGQDGANLAYIAACSPDRIRRLVEHVEFEQGHIYRLREQICRDTDTIHTLRGLLSLAREALADCLDDAPTADQLSVSGGVYEGVAAKSAIRAIDAALEGKE